MSVSLFFNDLVLHDGEKLISGETFWQLKISVQCSFVWLVLQEHQKGNRNIVISDTEMKQTVYIFKCENSTVQVKGKVNAITMGQCQHELTIPRVSVPEFCSVHVQ